MSGNRFNAKTYQGKDRVYQPVPGKTGILRLYIWDKNKKQYVDPPGKKYDVRRIEIGENGKKRRRKKMFAHLDQGVFWQQGNESVDNASASFANLSQFIDSRKSGRGMTFGDLVEDFKKRQFPKIGESTRVRYARMLDQYFPVLSDLVVTELKPSGIDLWLEEIKSLSSKSTRKFYKHELDLLKNLIGHYKEYFDEDNNYIPPFRKRHSVDAKNPDPRIGA